MTNDDLSTKVGGLTTSVGTLFTKMDTLATTVGALAMTVDALAMTVDGLATRMDTRFEALDQKVDQGFDKSKIRDEELRSLVKFGLEAREVLRDEMHRRFDASDRKHDEQITLLKDAVTYLSSHKQP